MKRYDSGMRRAMRAALLLLTAVLLWGCGDGKDLGDSPLPDFHGVWRGTLREATTGNFGEAVVTMEQRGAQVSGTWQATYYTVANGGTLGGSVATDGDSGSFSLSSSLSYFCPLNVTLVLHGDEATGNYATVPCPSSPDPAVGTVQVFRDGPGGPRYHPAPPPAPGQVTITAGDGENVLSWNLVDDATGYAVYWSTAPGVTPDTGSKIARATPPLHHTGLADGASYYYVVTASNLGGDSGPSAEVGATPEALPPPAPDPVPVPVPDGVSIVAGDGQITVGWNAVAGAAGYNLYWATASGVTKAGGVKVSSVASPFVHTGLTNGTMYHYVVTALAANGESSESTEVSAMPQASAVAAVDQQQPLIDSSAGVVYAIGGASEQMLAQVVTPAADGQLTEVRFPVGCADDLIVRIETVGGGLPAGTILGETVLSAALVGPHTSPPDFKSLQLAQPVPVKAGEQIAIVLDSPGSCGIYPGPVGDPYPGGNAFFDSRPNSKGVWVALSGGRSDLPFKTVVTPNLTATPPEAGLWLNGTYTGHTAKIELQHSIDSAGNEAWLVHGWGFCGGDYCDWGAVPGQRLPSGEVYGIWNFGWKTTEVWARMSTSQPGRLQTYMWNDYATWDGRTDFGLTEYFDRAP